MIEKRIKIGLDIGTNSVGWAVADVETNKLLDIGSRIIPMDNDAINKFGTGQLQSGAADRTSFRGVRRLYQRANLRRERLLRVLNVMGFLPKHFAEQIDFEEHPGQFKNHGEPLITHKENEDGEYEFIYMDSYNEMVADFAQRNQANADIPHDWTLYYLRHKALTEALTKEELAWVILNFNTKRGYYQLRSDKELSDNDKKEEYLILSVASVEKEDEKKGKGGKYKWIVTYENGESQKVDSVEAPREVGDKVELILTSKLDKSGNVKLRKDGSKDISIRAPKEDDWELVKKRTDALVKKSGLTVGSYIYKNILANPTIKVKGNLIGVIERDFYKEELEKILEVQKGFIDELRDETLYQACLNELYRRNKAHVNANINKDFTYLFVDDIIFYQRPLKSKKSEIADCPLEKYTFVNNDTGEVVEKAPKCIAKSNPYYEEFRLLQFLSNVKIFKLEDVTPDGIITLNKDVTDEYISSPEAFNEMFDKLKELKEINQKNFLKCFGLKDKDYRWNYAEDKKQPSCPVHYDIMKRLKKCNISSISFEDEMNLWHILYSVSDPIELQKALDTYARKHNFNRELFVENFANYPTFDSSYGSLSEKAIKKLLPLMRVGKYWNESNIDEKTLVRINNIISGVEDESINARTREKLQGLTRVEDFSGLPFWKAAYAVYGRHSESGDLDVWETPEDLGRFLKNGFKQHSLRNPVVEKVLTETLRVVKDIWKCYGDIDEIHVEMARNLKQNNDQRKRDTNKISENEETNLRIRRLLEEFVDPDYDVKDVRPGSFQQLDKFKIYESNVLSNNDLPDDIKTIKSNIGNPTKMVSKRDIMKYKLWLEQQYKSPYTGQPIPLSRLFTTDYEIEHVIPKSRYYDDSYSNKVICESEVNKLKDRMLGYEFIIAKGGQIVQLSNGNSVTIFDKEQYEDFVKENYAKDFHKMKKLLSEDIPQNFSAKQLNNTRYISRVALGFLSKIVRSEKDDTGAISKNVIPTNGFITDRLKQDWGFNDVWNQLVAPRFERMNELTGTTEYGQWVNSEGKRFFRTQIPVEASKGFSKKRIDHRHHAMDAVAILYTNRNHVMLFNNESAETDVKGLNHQLRSNLCEKVYREKDNYSWQFKLPYDNLVPDFKDLLNSTLVSFKQENRVITKNSNYYQTFDEKGRKIYLPQTIGNRWAIRKPLHKDTYYGAVRLPEIKSVALKDALDEIDCIYDSSIRKAIKAEIERMGGFDKKKLLKIFAEQDNIIAGKKCKKVELYKIPEQPTHSAVRKKIDEKISLKDINSVTDSGIKSILLNHIQNYGYYPELKDSKEISEILQKAFSEKGIEEMNSNIRSLNGGKKHKPIYSVRISEILGLKFSLGERGSKSKKFVESAKGTNLFFAIYADKEGNRTFETIPFYVVVDRMKAGEPVAPEETKDGTLLFTLSPDDLVYVPKPEEIDSEITEITDYSRVYKLVSVTQTSAFFIPYFVATYIPDYECNGKKVKELGSNNKAERDWTYEDTEVKDGPKGNMIKKTCIKLKVDRLGKITKIIQ